MEAALAALVEAIGSVVVTEAFRRSGAWLSRDVETKLGTIREEFESMQAFLRDAEELKGSTAATKGFTEIFINQVRELAYRVEDILDELMEFLHGRSGGGMRGAAHNICHLPEDMFITGPNLANKIDEINIKVQVLGRKRTTYHIPSGSLRRSYPQVHIELPYNDQTKTTVGMATNTALLVEWLTRSTERHAMMSIWGMGGLGKTTLARAAWSDPRVKQHFKKHAWVTVSQSSTLREVLQCIALELLQDTNVGALQVPNMNEGTLRQTITSVLDGSRYTIVLDDIWDSSLLESLFSIFPRTALQSRVLVTTRFQEIASYHPKHLAYNIQCNSKELKLLPQHEAKELFFLVAFGKTECPQFLQDCSMKIIKKCNGLPLAVVSIARVMASKHQDLEEWERMHRFLQWELTNNKELQTVTRTLMLSYNHLPYSLKRCFLYCAVFPRGYKIRVKMLVLMWIAQGLITERGDGKTLEDRAQDILEQLVDRSMLHVVKRNDARKAKVCQMHDLMRDLAIAVASEGEYICAEIGNPVTESSRARHMTILEASERPHHLTTLPDSRRRHIIQSTNPIGLHSLLFYGDCFDVNFLLRRRNLGLRFLRVLHLRGVHLKEVPDIIFSLVNLRYLSCRETEVCKIPRLLGNLYNLQTLDLQKTKVDHLLRELIKLQKLRHLLLDEVKDPQKLKYRNVLGWRGSEAPLGIGGLKELQTLRSIQADKHLVAQLEFLTQLRSLTITDVSNNIGFCNCISKISHLIRLSVKASPGNALELSAISPPPLHLRKLILRGSLASIPEWFKSINSLTHLYLFDSKLGEHQNLIPYIHQLRNLVVLALDDASRVPHLLFNGQDFLSLRTLSITNMDELQTMVIRKDAMPRLRLLHVQACKSLRCILGLEHLMELNELKLKELDELDITQINIHQTLPSQHTF